MGRSGVAVVAPVTQESDRCEYDVDGGEEKERDEVKEEREREREKKE